jgi:hypothetical protein
MNELAKRMHEAWLEVMEEQGYHDPDDRLCWDAEARRSGFPFVPCEKCRKGLVPWGQVPEPVKEVNRRGAKAMLSYLGFPEGAEPEEGCVGKAIEVLRVAFYRKYPDEVEADIKRAMGFLGITQAKGAMDYGDN